jgi:dihydroorotate dehydrogenase (fumarate)
MDGNEAVASVAYRTNEVITIYPITPASPMGEWADAWAAAQEQNIWGTIPTVVHFPIAVKLSAFFTSTAHMARRLAVAGAEALVLFNRFYQPDIDLETLTVEPHILLSTPQDMRLPLRWIAILYGRVQADLAATSGIYEAQDVLKMLMAGASVTMMCSALLQQGIAHLRVVEKDMRLWMEEHEYVSVGQMQGSMSQQHCEDVSAFERAHYVHALHTYRPD